jgi:hypothetical protein
MPRLTRIAWALLAFAAAATTLCAQSENADAGVEAATRARALGMAVFSYQAKHNDEMPADLAAIAEFLAAESKTSLRDVIIKNFLTPIDGGVKVPTDADAAWVNDHSSFVYLAGGIRATDLPDWTNTVLAHQRLDRPTPSDPTPDNPEGGWIVLSYFDGHSTITTRADARARIAESMKFYDAVRTGADFPDAAQTVWDLEALQSAIRAYAKARDGHLPPTLGDTLPFLPSDPKRLATGTQRARVYLSPHAKKNVFLPDNPTAEWVNQNASYIYTGSADLVLSEIEDPQRLVLLYARPEDALTLGSSPVPFLPQCTVSGRTDPHDPEYTAAIVAETRAVFEAMRTGRPLPDYQATLRDMRLIHAAIAAYDKDEKSLPPDLGSTLPYLLLQDLKDTSDDAIARVYLSPRAERSRGPLSEPLTPEWINRHTSYTYLGRPGITIQDCRRAGVQFLVHTPLDEAIELPFPGQRLRIASTCGSSGVEWLVADREAGRIDEAKAAIAATKPALPKAESSPERATR